MRSAVRGLVERDAPLIDRVLAGDGPINQLHIEIDHRCFKLLALHQRFGQRVLRPPLAPHLAQVGALRVVQRLAWATLGKAVVRQAAAVVLATPSADTFVRVHN